MCRTDAEVASDYFMPGWGTMLIIPSDISHLHVPMLNLVITVPGDGLAHDDVIKWNYFPRYWPYVRGIHRSPVNSPHKGQ